MALRNTPSTGTPESATVAAIAVARHIRRGLYGHRCPRNGPDRHRDRAGNRGCHCRCLAWCEPWCGCRSLGREEAVKKSVNGASRPLCGYTSTHGGRTGAPGSAAPWLDATGRWSLSVGIVCCLPRSDGGDPLPVCALPARHQCGRAASSADVAGLADVRSVAVDRVLGHPHWAGRAAAGAAYFHRGALKRQQRIRAHRSAAPPHRTPWALSTATPAGTPGLHPTASSPPPWARRAPGHTAPDRAAASSAPAGRPTGHHRGCEGRAPQTGAGIVTAIPALRRVIDEYGDHNRDASSPAGTYGPADPRCRPHRQTGLRTQPMGIVSASCMAVYGRASATPNTAPGRTHPHRYRLRRRRDSV